MNDENPIELLKAKALEKSEDQQKSDMIEYLYALVKGVENGEWREEYAANQMVQALLEAGLINDPEFELIFECAADTEIPRETSYKQPMGIGKWNEVTANKIKTQEWKQLAREVSNRWKKKSGILHRAVLDIDEVEYLITDDAEKAIQEKQSEIILVRLFDKMHRTFTLNEIEDAIQGGGIVDYL